MFSQNLIKIKMRRCLALALLVVLLFMGLMWPQLTYDLIFEGLDVVWYKYLTKRNLYLCVKLQGGIGNMLFQYTFAHSMAKRTNFTLVCERDKMQELQELFSVPNCAQHPVGERVCLSEMYTNPTPLDIGYDAKVVKNIPKKDIHYLGYFQSWKYWIKYEDEFKRYLTIREDVKEKATTVIDSEIRKLGFTNRSDVTLVGVHIRRGDMLERKFYNYGYNVVSEEYITEAKNYIRARVKGPIVYIVCSNGMDWTREIMMDSNAVLMTGNSRELDFALLSVCDHFIMSVGTFGWWVGWHVKGIVTFYTKPFRPGTEFETVFTDDYLKSFFYPGWVGIS